jgi:dienelactone hydrolase
LRYSHFVTRSVAPVVFAAALTLFTLCAPPALAQDTPPEAPQLADDIHETIVKLPVTVTLLSGKSHTGQTIVTHFRPNGAGPFPVVIVNHGRSAARDKRATPARQRYTAVARYWIRRGFAVFVPTRLGYGDAGLDPDPEFSGNSCDDRKFGVTLAAVLKHVGATLDFAKTLSWSDTSRAIIVGQSVGGFASIGASAEKLPGVLATINFAGGSGGDPDTHPTRPCSPSQMTAIINDAGKRARVPMLWLYAENDKFWGADWPRKWHAAYVQGGGRAELKTFPPVAEDGHQLIGKGFRLWRPVVDEFMAKLGFPPPKSNNAPQPTGFARLDDAGKLPYVKDIVKTEGYQKFLDADLPRAFAIGPNGGWAWRIGKDAPKEALERCEQNAKRPCGLYAVDDAVVWKP